MNKLLGYAEITSVYNQKECYIGAEINASQVDGEKIGARMEIQLRFQNPISYEKPVQLYILYFTFSIAVWKYFIHIIKL